jgi:tRNA G18 (ribose-2'-O)-methylase SpoU
MVSVPEARRPIVVDDPDDPRLTRFRLRDRGLAAVGRRHRDAPGGYFVAEGDLVVERALAAGHRIDAVLIDERRPSALLELLPADVPVFAASAAVRAHVTGLGVPLEVLALFHRPPPGESAATLVGRTSRLVVLEAVDNPTNLGAIVRTAAGLGVDGVLLDATSADPLARRAVRTSMGAVFTLPIARIEALPTDGLALLHAAGFRTVALTPDAGAIPIDELCVSQDERVALLLGSERGGLEAATIAASIERVRIPMHHGVDSLNVAAAAAIACYAITRRAGHRS